MEVVKDEVYIFSESILKGLEGRLIAFKESPLISFTTKNQLGLNGFLNDIQYYLDMLNYISSDVKKFANDGILQIMKESNMKELSYQLGNFIPQLLDFLIKSGEREGEDYRVTNYYIKETTEVIKVIKKALEDIIMEIERIDYTLRVTEDYGLLNAFNCMRNEKEKSRLTN